MPAFSWLSNVRRERGFDLRGAPTQRRSHPIEVYSQFPWQWSANFHPNSAGWMRKPDPSRMQKISLEERQLARTGPQATRRAIERVSNYWMPDGRKMSADLVCAPGVEHGLDQCAAVQSRNH